MLTRVERMRAWAKMGMSKTEMACRLNISRDCVSRICRQNNIKVPDGRRWNGNAGGLNRRRKQWDSVQ